MLAETKFTLPYNRKEDLEAPSIGKEENGQTQINSMNFPL